MSLIKKIMEWTNGWVLEYFSMKGKGVKICLCGGFEQFYCLESLTFDNQEGGGVEWLNIFFHSFEMT